MFHSSAKQVLFHSFSPPVLMHFSNKWTQVKVYFYGKLKQVDQSAVQAMHIINNPYGQKSATNMLKVKN